MPSIPTLWSLLQRCISTLFSTHYRHYTGRHVTSFDGMNTIFRNLCLEIWRASHIYIYRRKCGRYVQSLCRLVLRLYSPPLWPVVRIFGVPHIACVSSPRIRGSICTAMTEMAALDIATVDTSIKDPLPYPFIGSLYTLMTSTSTSDDHFNTHGYTTSWRLTNCC